MIHCIIIKLWKHEKWQRSSISQWVKMVRVTNCTWMTWPKLNQSPRGPDHQCLHMTKAKSSLSMKLWLTSNLNLYSQCELSVDLLRKKSFNLIFSILWMFLVVFNFLSINRVSFIKVNFSFSYYRFPFLKYIVYF